jgi:hypothetical protein
MTGKSLTSFHSSPGDYLQQKFQDENDSNKGNSNGSSLVSVSMHIAPSLCKEFK